MTRFAFVVLFGFVLILDLGCRQKPEEVASPQRTAPATNPEEAVDFPIPEEPFQVKFETSNGTFFVEVVPEWSPIGAGQFKRLVEADFYDGNRFFRIVPGFIAQWGMHGDPEVHAKWKDRTIPDEPVKRSNVRGTLAFAKPNAPNSRSCQVFVNLGDNTRSLDPQGFSTFGHVIQGMDVIDTLNKEYGEQPNQGAIAAKGNEYLNANFPRLDYIKEATILEPGEEVSIEGVDAAAADESEKTAAESDAAETEATSTEAAEPAPEETIEEIE